MPHRIIISCALINIGVQWGFFVISALLRTELFFDLIGSLTFLLLAFLSYFWGSIYSVRQYIQTWMIAIWAVRLGLYLFTRILKEGKDWRFERVRERRRLLFLYWTLQAFWIYITLFPSLLLNISKKEVPLGVRDFLGWTVWAAGFVCEAIADHQKAAFKSKIENKEKFISTGLWSISRHPNYFGEILLWFGLFLSASSVLEELEYLSVLCPIFNMLLITRVTGVPILETESYRRWGDDPAYNEYLRHTSVLIPFVW